MQAGPACSCSGWRWLPSSRQPTGGIPCPAGHPWPEVCQVGQLPTRLQCTHSVQGMSPVQSLSCLLYSRTCLLYGSGASGRTTTCEQLCTTPARPAAHGLGPDLLVHPHCLSISGRLGSRKKHPSSRGGEAPPARRRLAAPLANGQLRYLHQHQQ